MQWIKGIAAHCGKEDGEGSRNIGRANRKGVGVVAGLTENRMIDGCDRVWVLFHCQYCA